MRMETSAPKAQPTSPADPGEALERVLRLALAERALRNSPGWRADLEGTIEAHGEACDRLYDELYRLLDEREAAGEPVQRLRMPPDPRKELKAQIVKRLKDELPSMVASIIDEF
jgi:hypothetical protein